MGSLGEFFVNLIVCRLRFLVFFLLRKVVDSVGWFWDDLFF